MSHDVNRERLRATLGQRELVRLVDALRTRMERGRPLTGALSLAAPTDAERAAVDALLGRTTSRGMALRVDLDFLADVLRHGDVAPDLESAVVELVGPISNRRATVLAANETWARLLADAHRAFRDTPNIALWIERLVRTGVLRRMVKDAAEARRLIDDLARFVVALPVSAEPLTRLAARLFGSAHALDRGAPLGTLAVRAAALIGGAPFGADAESRRAAWASVGVLGDDLSALVLVLNLPSAATTPLGQALNVARAAGEPLHLSLRWLLRYPLSDDPALRGARVYGCENPAIVSMAADRFGSRCSPLICVGGQFATPALILLRHLRIAGAELLYHGDFDPGGLVIARRVFREFTAVPWRYGTADYACAPKGIPFASELGSTPWDPELAGAMRAISQSVHEEAVFETLAIDLCDRVRN